MRGYLNIAKMYGLTTPENDNLGIFQWKRRMGIHLAFHRDPMNIFLHALFPVFNALGVLMICYPFFIDVPGNLSLLPQSLSLALLVLAGSFFIYALIDLLAAILVSLPVLLLYPLCQWSFEALGQSVLWMTCAGIAVFFVALWIQVGIGHKICEEGIGDEEENIAELFESKNPIPFIVLPVYTILDLLFMLGYRKTLSTFIWKMTDELRPKLLAQLQSNSPIHNR